MQRVRPGQRVPIKKIIPEQYNSQTEIKTVIKNYEQKMFNKYSGNKRRILIVGHGRLHPKHPDLPVDKAILLDLNPVCIPDILGDMKHTGFMARFPKNYFHEIILLYTPPPSPIAAGNLNIWSNLAKILRPGGILRSNYILHVFYKKKVNMVLAKKRVWRYFTALKLFKQIKYVNMWIHLIK